MRRKRQVRARCRANTRRGPSRKLGGSDPHDPCLQALMDGVGDKPRRNSRHPAKTPSKGRLGPSS
eukprot:15477733-Alexandrium_andersonii.AAC.1